MCLCAWKRCSCMKHLCWKTDHWRAIWYAWYTHTLSHIHKRSISYNKKVRMSCAVFLWDALGACFSNYYFHIKYTKYAHESYFEIHYSILSFAENFPLQLDFFFLFSVISSLLFLLWIKIQDPKPNHFACIRTFNFI